MGALEAGSLCPEDPLAMQAKQVKCSIKMCPVVLVSLGSPRLWGRRDSSCCCFPG